MGNHVQNEPIGSNTSNRFTIIVQNHNKKAVCPLSPMVYCCYGDAVLFAVPHNPVVAQFKQSRMR